MIPFALPEAPGEPFDLPEDDPSPGRRRAVLGLTALAVSALAVGGFLLFGSGPDDEALAVGVPPRTAGQAAAEASPAPAPVPALPPAASVQVDGRNPFAPLHGTSPDAPSVVPAAGGSDADAGTGSGTGTGTGVTDAAGPAVGPALPSGSGSADPASPDPATPDQARLDPISVDTSTSPASPARVVLSAVTGTGTTRSAVLVLDGSPTTVAVGDSFGPGGTLQLVSVQEGPGDGQWTAVLRSGDADPFDVVSGVPTRLP